MNQIITLKFLIHKSMKSMTHWFNKKNWMSSLFQELFIFTNNNTAIEDFYQVQNQSYSTIDLFYK